MYLIADNPVVRQRFPHRTASQIEEQRRFRIDGVDGRIDEQHVGGLTNGGLARVSRSRRCPPRDRFAYVAVPRVHVAEAVHKRQCACHFIRQRRGAQRAIIEHSEGWRMSEKHIDP